MPNALPLLQEIATKARMAEGLLPGHRAALSQIRKSAIAIAQSLAAAQPFESPLKEAMRHYRRD